MEIKGGYAVESALPYVNVGIIMAMAGLDTSTVKEPDYRPRPQSPEVTRKIKDLTSRLKKTFLQGGLEKASHRQGDVVERRRDIFYDTDGILERQRELVRVCSNCAGAVGLESAASTGSHVFAVQIPAGACPGCRETAESWYAQACSGPFDQVMLRDRDRRTFHRTGPTKE